MNATYALRGMSLSHEPGGRAVFLGALSYRLRRWQLAARILALRWVAWVAATMQVVAARALPAIA